LFDVELAVVRNGLDHKEPGVPIARAKLTEYECRKLADARADEACADVCSWHFSDHHEMSGLNPQSGQEQTLDQVAVTSRDLMSTLRVVRSQDAATRRPRRISP
jgi:hypothetical protein